MVLSGAQRTASHSVQFYEASAALIEKLAEFVGTALGTGGACLVIVNQEHRRMLAERLQAWSLDLKRASRTGQYIVLDADECLSKFMVDGWPNRTRFFRMVGAEFKRARQGAVSKPAKVRAFGEMVALLAGRAQFDAAIQLERLWNEVVRRYSADLMCAYPLSCFAHDPHLDLFSLICREHTQVVPTESYTSLEADADRERMVTTLQQEASVVHAVAEERERAIAQRKSAEDKLWRSQQFAQKVVEGGLDCVKVLDVSGRIEYMSESGLAALEIRNAQQVLGRSWIDIWKMEDRDRAKNALETALSGDISKFQGDVTTASGSHLYWDVRISPVQGRDGRIECLIAVSRDLTELRQAQQIAVQAEKFSAAGRMAATIAHEINNPLEAVTNFIYLARTTPGMPEEAARQLEIADRELARVARIAQKTLGFYRDNSRNKWVSASELVDDVMLIYDRKLRTKRIETRVSVDSKLKLFAKLGEIKQALSNLLANAIDASGEGGSVWIRAHASSLWADSVVRGIRFTVADNGAGMSLDVQKRIFIPFFTTKAQSGTGIGLWVTRSLIEQHGGHMRFRSCQGPRSGTIMSFFIPTSSHAQQAAESIAA